MTNGHEERGRETFASTGRGGAGNAVRSPSRGRPSETPEESKAAAQYLEHQKVVHAGRGGAGNLRSPSRDPKDRAKAQELEKKEHQMQAEAIKRDQHSVHSSGRGGMGNMAHSRGNEDDGRGRENVVSSAIRSLSRSRSREPRSSSGQRAAHDGATDKLASVDEGSTINGSHSEKEKHGFASKLASHIPGFHSHDHK